MNKRLDLYKAQHKHWTQFAQKIIALDAERVKPRSSPLPSLVKPTLLLPALTQAFEPVVCGTDLIVLIESGVNLTAKRLLAHINFAPEVQAPNERLVMKIIYLQGRAACESASKRSTLLACPSRHVHARLFVWYALHG